MTIQEIKNAFSYHPPKGDQVIKLRDQAKDLAESIVTMTPPSREQSLALTKLRECIMWATACNE